MTRSGPPSSSRSVPPPAATARPLPRVVSTLLTDLMVGTALGALFLAGLAALDPGGLARLVLDLPFLLSLAVVAGGIAPFAMGFAATGLDYRSRDDGA